MGKKTLPGFSEVKMSFQDIVGLNHSKYFTLATQFNPTAPGKPQ